MSSGAEADCRTNPLRSLTPRSAFALLLRLPALASAQFATVRIQVVDVGQGDGILIRTPNKHWILIDTGPSHSLADALPNTFGVGHLDVAVLSHRHLDHGAGMHRVLELLDVDEFWGDTSSMDAGANKFMKELRSCIKATHTPVATPESEGTDADTLNVDGVQFIFVPRPPYDSNNENNNSLVVRLDYGEFSMLFTGDAEVAEREWLVEHFRDLVDVDVLKAAHHGSHNGTSIEWLDAVTPEVVVISAGVRADYKHPHEEAVKAYLEAAHRGLFCTNRQSTIRIYGRQDGKFSVYPYNKNDKSCTYDGTHY